MNLAGLSPVHIAVLDCDTPVPNVYPERGLYSDIFEVLLRDAQRSNENLKDLDLAFSKYDCVHGQLPSEKDLSKIDALIITGAAAAAYDQEPWIFALAKFIQCIYTTHPNIKLFGSCFGHQLICHVLFSTPTNTVVARDPAGWELGVHPITLSAPFIAHYGTVTSNTAHPNQLRQQFVHADHVVLPILPKGWHSVGSSEHCALQGVWQQGRVLTYQGHAEFDRFINRETLKIFGKAKWADEFMRSSLEAVDRDDDAAWAAGVMLKFFLESRAEIDERGTLGSEGGANNEEVMARL